MPTQIPLKEKYRSSGWAKKQKSSSNDSGHTPKRRRYPAPVSRLRTLHLVEGRKLVWEG